MTFEICRDPKSQTWVVYRVGGSHEQHAHLKSRKGCKLLIKLIRQGSMPRSQYMQISCQRLLLPHELARLKREKDRYVNRARRV